MAFRDHFSARAPGYAAFRPSYPAALIDFLADLSPARELAWDAGCGSGQFTVPLATRFRRVVGTDESAQQLAQAKRTPGVRYARASAEASGLSSGVVDLATAAQAAHWFDIETYFAEVERVTRPGSILALVTYGLMSVEPEIDRLVRHLHSNRLRGFWPPEREHVEERYRSLPFPFPEIRAPDFEIRMEWTLSDVLGYLATWSAVRALEVKEGAGALAGFGNEVAAAWGHRERTRPVRWPLALRVGRVGG